jgi:hypothetical protein
MGHVVPSARSISVFGDTAFVLFVGQTGQRGRLVDMYRLSTGSYEGSLLLPVVASDLAVTRERLVVLARESVPQVISYRYRFHSGTGRQAPDR